MKIHTFLFLLLATGAQAQVNRFSDPAFVPVHTGKDAGDVKPSHGSAAKTSCTPYHFTKADSTTLIRHRGYISAIHNKYHIPAWTYHQISRALLPQVGSPGRPNGYAKDGQYPQLKATMYEGSEYEHGHLAPAADFKREKSLYVESHLMTNMSPQHGCFNQIGWCYLESMTRNWASEDSTTLTHVISGCILGEFRDTLCYGDDFRIYVPKYFFKAILIEDTVHPEKSRAIGFVVQNDYLTKEQATAAQCPIDQIEQLTGLDLFTGITRLNAHQLSLAESKVGTFHWEGFKVDCGSKACEGVYTGKRIRPGKRTKLRCG